MTYCAAIFGCFLIHCTSDDFQVLIENEDDPDTAEAVAHTLSQVEHLKHAALAASTYNKQFSADKVAHESFMDVSLQTTSSDRPDQQHHNLQSHHIKAATADSKHAPSSSAAAAATFVAGDSNSERQLGPLMSALLDKRVDSAASWGSGSFGWGAGHQRTASAPVAISRSSSITSHQGTAHDRPSQAAALAATQGAVAAGGPGMDSRPPGSLSACYKTADGHIDRSAAAADKEQPKHGHGPLDQSASATPAAVGLSVKTHSSQHGRSGTDRTAGINGSMLSPVKEGGVSHQGHRKHQSAAAAGHGFGVERTGSSTAQPGKAPLSEPASRLTHDVLAAASALSKALSAFSAAQSAYTAAGSAGSDTAEIPDVARAPRSSGMMLSHDLLAAAEGVSHALAAIAPSGAAAMAATNTNMSDVVRSAPSMDRRSFSKQPSVGRIITNRPLPYGQHTPSGKPL